MASTFEYGTAIFALFCLFFTLRCIIACKRAFSEDEDPELTSIRVTISERRRELRETNVPSPYPPNDIEEMLPRGEQFLSKFKFQTVTTQQNKNEENTQELDLDSIVDDASVIEECAADGSSQSKWTIRGILSTWRTPAKSDSCCICLQEYSLGDTICAAETSECDHVFHQECIFEWLQNDHNDCPLCRTDLLNA